MPRPVLWGVPSSIVPPPTATTHLDKGLPLKSAISRALQNLMLSGISGMSVTGEGSPQKRCLQPPETQSPFRQPHDPTQTPPGLHTIPGHVQLHQLHEVGHLWGQSLDLVVTQAQLAQIQQPEEGLGVGVGSGRRALWQTALSEQTQVHRSWVS